MPSLHNEKHMFPACFHRVRGVLVTDPGNRHSVGPFFTISLVFQLFLGGGRVGSVLALPASCFTR